MQLRLLNIILMIALLGVGESLLAQPTKGKQVVHESFSIYGDNGKAAGSISFFREEDGKDIISIYYSGSPEVIASQSLPWTRWHDLPGLSDVHISLTTINADLARYLAKIKTLRTLSIEGCLFGACVPGLLGELQQLEHLEIYFSAGHVIDDWKFLGKLSGLKSLTVVGASVSPDFGSQFRGLSGLEQLECWLDDEASDAVMPQLSHLQSIKLIRITRVR